MINRTENYYIRMAWLLIGICTIGRVFYAQAFLLTPDETNYWQWARHLDWGYHDQTPMIAWTIRLATLIVGHTELAVRLPSILSMAVASVYLVLMARHWFSPRIAWQTALLSQSVFLFNVGALLATADGLQGAAWAAASYHTARGFENHHWRQWILGGVWFGFGMLSKYTMVLFLPFVYCFGLFTPDCRPRLASIRPYIGCAVGIIMFIPVIAWNAANNWNSFRHVAYIGGANERFAFHLNYLGEFIASQAGLLTPLVFILICASWLWVLRRWGPSGQWIYSYLFFTSFPMVAGFAVLSIHSRVYGNWPGAGYLTAIVLTAALWSQRSQSSAPSNEARTRGLWRWTLGSAVLLTALVLTHVLWPILPIPAHIDRTAYELRGWDHLGSKVHNIQAGMPSPEKTFLFGVRYQIASELAFYVPGQPKTVAINRWDRPNVYDYWWQDADLIGKDAVGVAYEGNRQHRFLETFERVDPPIPFPDPEHPIEMKADGKDTPPPARNFYIYRCYGFKGGLRWVPPHAKDVRAADQ